MPLLWRYLLANYLKLFFLCVSAFIAILMTMRLDEIANFAALSPDMGTLLWFVIQQIPYVLPIAFPVAALISATLVARDLSEAQEITAMRSCGFALRDLVAPILLAALALSLLNFYVVSELATASHLNSGRLKNELRSVNPLLLVHNRHVMKMRGYFFASLGSSHIGEYDTDALFFFPGKHNERLNMLAAKKLQMTPTGFLGDQVTVMIHQKHGDGSGPDQLIIENFDQITIAINDFIQMMDKKNWSVNNDQLKLPLLLVRLAKSQELLTVLKSQGASNSEMKAVQIECAQCLSEIFRRLSAALAVFSFSLMGLAFGINISRNRSMKGTLYLVILTAFYLGAFFAAKNLDTRVAESAMLYLIPHGIIIIASLWALRRIARGIES